MTVGSIRVVARFYIIVPILIRVTRGITNRLPNPLYMGRPPAPALVICNVPYSWLNVIDSPKLLASLHLLNVLSVL